MRKKYICGVEQISPDNPYLLELGEMEQVVVFQTAEGYFAVENRCPHAGAFLHEGQVNGQVLTCIWHGWKFDLESGQSLTEYWARLRTYPVIREDEDLYLEIKDENN